MIDVGQLKILGAVFHPVPAGASRGEPSDEPPVLSTVESKLDGRLEFFLRDRLTRTFSQAAQPIRRDVSRVVPTPDLILSCLNGDQADDIVRPFHPLPSLLVDVQSHNSPKGLLAVVRGECGATKVLVVVKIEQERGLSFQTFTEDDEIRVEVAIEDGLVFTDKTEVFKSALFYLDHGDLVGVLTDDQSGSAYTGPSSQYWLQDFLGCEFSNDLDVQTRAWIRATERTIKSDIGDPSRQSSTLSAMIGELGSNRSSINPGQFVRDFVPAEAQDKALQRLRDNGLTARPFRKSRAVAAKAPKRKRIVFDSGYEVRMPADVEPELTKEVVDEQTVDVLVIRGHIKHVDS